MEKNRTSRTSRATAVIAATTALMAVGLGAASAHVGVTPESTTEGGYTQLTFSVPNESETAATDKVEVELPTDTPFTSVRAKPVPGWTAEVITSDLPEPGEVQGTTLTKAPSSVVWTAEDGRAISAEQYQTFSLSVGTLPEAGTTVMLPTAQYYTDAEVRNWEEPAVKGRDEPESPAPSFVTTQKQAAADQENTDPAATTEDTDAAAAPAADTVGRTVGWIGFGAGVLGLIAGVTALMRTRNTSSS